MVILMVKNGIKDISVQTALGLDQWDVKWLRALSNEALEELAVILNMVECNGSWPDYMLNNTIVLMGKPPPWGWL